MTIGIYYGGRGVIEDPTKYAVDLIRKVITDLNLSVVQYNIYEHRSEISKLASTLSDLDGVILATTVEWLGIGGYMTQFLDALWLYGDREKMAELYMQPVVLSTTYGEREGMRIMETAWESLGGKLASGICGYVEDPAAFRSNETYRNFIEKKTEDFYRTIHLNMPGLPTSTQAVEQSVAKSRRIPLTPAESEFLSNYVADEDKVRKQKEDVQELSKIYNRMIKGEQAVPVSAVEKNDEFIEDFKKIFVPNPDIIASFLFNIEEKELPLFIEVEGTNITAVYEDIEEADVTSTLRRDVMEAIIAGRMSFQRAFSVGNMSVKGSFATLRKLDELFPFGL